MAKNARRKAKPVPDDDGILRTGIYERDCRPRKSMAASKFMEAMKERILSPKRQPTINEWLDGHISFFATILHPYVKPEAIGKSAMVLNMGDGWKPYQVEDELEEICRDAIEGMRAIRLLQNHIDANGTLAADGSTLNLVMQQTYNLGRVIERVTAVRPFEHAALVGRNNILRMDDVRANRRNDETLHEEALEAVEQAKRDAPDRRHEIDFIKKRAADSLGITKRALNMRLKK